MIGAMLEAPWGSCAAVGGSRSQQRPGLATSARRALGAASAHGVGLPGRAALRQPQPRPATHLVASSNNGAGPSAPRPSTPVVERSEPSTVAPPPPQRRASQWERFQGFVQAGDAKEAWLCISASVLQLAFPASLLVLLLHGSLWGGAPPGPVGALEAAALAGAVVAGGTEVWKILEGFQG